MVKIAFFDVDGTLLRFRHKDISDLTKKALLKLKENGVLLCMATGRSLPCVPHFEGVDFDIYMTFNGAYIKYGEKLIRDIHFSREDCNQLIANLKEMNRPLAISNDRFVVANGKDDDLQEYFDVGMVELVVSDDFERLSHENIYQIMCSCNESEYDRILHGTKNVQVEAWWDRAADIIPKCGGKGDGVRAILEYFDFDPSESIAFGDGRNDIEMIKAVGTGVAMGNAGDNVKEAADIICRSCDDDGIYYYCIENDLI